MDMHHIDNLLNSRPEVVRERMIRVLIHPSSDFHNLLKTYSEANFKEAHRSELRACVLNSLEILNIDIINISIEGTCNPFLLAIEYAVPGLEPRRFESDIYVGISDLRAELIRRLQHDDNLEVSKLGDGNYVIGNVPLADVGEPGYIGNTKVDDLVSMLKETVNKEEVPVTEKELKFIEEYDEKRREQIYGTRAEQTKRSLNAGKEGEVFPEVEMMPEGHQTEGEKKFAKEAVTPEEYYADEKPRFNPKKAGQESVRIERDASGNVIAFGEDGRVIRGGGEDDLTIYNMQREEEAKRREERARTTLVAMEGKLIRDRSNYEGREVVEAQDPITIAYFATKHLQEEIGKMNEDNMKNTYGYAGAIEALIKLASLHGISEQRIDEVRSQQRSRFGCYSKNRILLP